jgi:hypothetical protein
VTHPGLLGWVGVVLAPGLATVGIAPLLGPLRRRTEAHREQVSAATSMAADIVSGTPRWSVPPTSGGPLMKAPLSP